MASHETVTRQGKIGEDVSVAHFQGAHFSGPAFKGQKVPGVDAQGHATGANCWVCVPDGHHVTIKNLPEALQVRYVVGPQVVAQFVQGRWAQPPNKSTVDRFIISGGMSEEPVTLQELKGVTMTYHGADKPAEQISATETVSVHEPQVLVVAGRHLRGYGSNQLQPVGAPASQANSSRMPGMPAALVSAANRIPRRVLAGSI